jgi:hypothetical protein
MTSVAISARFSTGPGQVFVASAVRSIFDQLAERFADAAAMLEWAVGRGYMSAESLQKASLEVIEGEAVEEVRGELVAAS